jgi:enoyl-CoA hydratase/carnithine racemase
MTDFRRDDDPAVSVETTGSVSLVSLNRSNRRNAINWDIWERLDHVIDMLGKDDDVQCLVLTGSGGFFSAGGDRKSGPDRGTRAMALGARIEFGLGVIRRLRELPMITVAAVEGGAIGMGWSLAQACDLIVVAEDAFFSAPFLALGLVPDGGLTWHLVHRLGRHRVTQLLLSGERITAVEAHALGLATQVVAAGTAAQAALSLGESIAAFDGKSVDLTKRLIAQAEQSELPAYVPYELALATLIQHHRADPG